MKKSLLLSCVALISLLTHAQIEKKNVLFGGNLGIQYQQTGQNNNASNSTIQPFVQFAYKKNRTIGFNMDIWYNSQKSNDGLNKQQTFSVGPSANLTQYHPLKGAFGWWFQQEAGMRFASSTYTSQSGEQKSDATTVFANLTPGIYYALGENKNWLLTASVGGIGGSYSGSNGVDSWGIGTNLFQYYRFGFAYIFGK